MFKPLADSSAQWQVYHQRYFVKNKLAREELTINKEEFTTTSISSCFNFVLRLKKEYDVDIMTKLNHESLAQQIDSQDRNQLLGQVAFPMVNWGFEILSRFWFG